MEFPVVNNMVKTWQKCGKIMALSSEKDYELRLRYGSSKMSSTQIFASVPKRDVLHLFNSEGQPDYKRTVEFLHFSKNDVAAAADVPQASVRYDSRMSDDLKDRIKEWAIAISLVAEFFEDEGKTLLWFSTPNPMLGGLRPNDMIKIGRFNKLHKFIITALQESRPSK